MGTILASIVNSLYATSASSGKDLKYAAEDFCCQAAWKSRRNAWLPFKALPRRLAAKRPASYFRSLPDEALVFPIQKHDRTVPLCSQSGNTAEPSPCVLNPETRQNRPLVFHRPLCYVYIAHVSKMHHRKIAPVLGGIVDTTEPSLV